MHPDTRTPRSRALTRILEHSSDLLALLDPEGRALEASASLARALGRDPGELIGAPALDHVHPDDRTSVLLRARRVSAGRPVSGVRLRLLRSDGGTVGTRWTLASTGGGGLCAVGRERGEGAATPGDARSGDEVGLRLRTAMELHDGILQALTGANLQIAVARRLIREDPSRAEAVLADLAEVVSAEHREIRLYVDEVKGEAARSAAGGGDFEERLSSMLDRVQTVWGVRTSLESDLRGELSSETRRRVLRIIQEATVNAARHGGAEAVAVRVESEGDELRIHLVDDGHGFPFRGEYDTAELREKRLGPVSLKHRIAEVDGKILLRSTADGTRLAIRVPTGRGEGT